MYGTRLTEVSLHNSSIDDSVGADLLASLQECTQLTTLDIGAMSNLIGASSGIRRVLERNKDSLFNIALPVSDADLPELLPAMKECTGLTNFTCGSPQLTNESTPAIAEVLHLIPRVNVIGFHSRMATPGLSSWRPRCEA